MVNVVCVCVPTSPQRFVIEVKTKGGSKYFIYRRYREFFTLHQNLESKYSPEDPEKGGPNTCLLPPLPGEIVSHFTLLECMSVRGLHDDFHYNLNFVSMWKWNPKNCQWWVNKIRFFPMATGKQVKRALQPHLAEKDIYALLHVCLEGNNETYGDIAAYVLWLSEPIFQNCPSSFHVGSFFPHKWSLAGHRWGPRWFSTPAVTARWSSCLLRRRK